MRRQIGALLHEDPLRVGDLSAPDYTTLSRRSQHLRRRLRPPVPPGERAKTEPASARKRHIRSSPATGSRGVTVSTMARRCSGRSSTTARRCCQSTNVDARAIVVGSRHCPC